MAVYQRIPQRLISPRGRPYWGASFEIWGHSSQCGKICIKILRTIFFPELQMRLQFLDKCFDDGCKVGDPGVGLGFWSWSCCHFKATNLVDLFYGFVVSAEWKGNSTGILINCKYSRRIERSGRLHVTLTVFCFG